MYAFPYKFYYFYIYFDRYLVEQGVHVNQQNKVSFFSSGNIIIHKVRIYLNNLQNFFTSYFAYFSYFKKFNLE